MKVMHYLGAVGQLIADCTYCKDLHVKRQQLHQTHSRTMGSVDLMTAPH